MVVDGFSTYSNRGNEQDLRLDTRWATVESIGSRSQAPQEKDLQK